MPASTRSPQKVSASLRSAREYLTVTNYFMGLFVTSFVVVTVLSLTMHFSGDLYAAVLATIIAIMALCFVYYSIRIAVLQMEQAEELRSGELDRLGQE